MYGSFMAHIKNFLRGISATDEFPGIFAGHFVPQNLAMCDDIISPVETLQQFHAFWFQHFLKLIAVKTLICAFSYPHK